MYYELFICPEKVIVEYFYTLQISHFESAISKLNVKEQKWTRRTNQS